MSWPVLNHYEGDALRQIAFPLGGIGTGTICLGGRGELKDFELFNTPAKGVNPPYTFFALWCKQGDSPAVTRIVEGELPPPYDGAFGAPGNLAGLPRLRHVALDACYPFARYTFGDPDLPLTVHLEAFNPLIPLDADRSGLPLAVLRYVLVNDSEQPVQASLCGSLYNFIGSDLFATPSRGSSSTPTGPGKQWGANVNEARSEAAGGAPLAGLLMRSTMVEPRTPQDGTLALSVLSNDVSRRRSWGPIRRWNGHILAFWDDFSADGRLDDPAPVVPSPAGQGMIGSVAASVAVPAHSSLPVTFLLTWHFPHRTAAGCGWETRDPEGGWVGNYYTQPFADAWDVAVQTASRLPELEKESLRFARAFVASDLPQAIKEAALNNVSTLRSTTCFRTANGDFFGFEGCGLDRGCCFGSCTHVWNYEQATASLFPELARNMRRLELQTGTLPSGANDFRLLLPVGSGPWNHTAADGQMGVVMKCYREWQMGDVSLLTDHWPAIRSLLSYSWLPGGWDADEDGVMEGIQHNTYDVEFFGPNPLCGVWYLGALRAGVEMARAAGDDVFADHCQSLFQRGSAWIDAHLFNGEYYVQQIRPPASLEEARPELLAGMGTSNLSEPEFQVGDGCLIDQLVGQYMAHVVGLGHLLKPEHVATALRSLFRYNFRANLHGHWNNMRTFALNDEAALLICSWPHGDRLQTPFPYFNEVMTGFEYQAAAHMIYEGLLDEGLTVITAIRQRFDGHRRNPWNEPECGHHYARAMASWAAVLALSGFHHSAISGRLELAPAGQPSSFNCIWTVAAGWGAVRWLIENGEIAVRWDVLHGELAVQSMRYRLPAGARAGRASVQVGVERLAVRTTQDGNIATLALPRRVVATPEASILAHLHLTALER